MGHGEKGHQTAWRGLRKTKMQRFLMCCRLTKSGSCFSLSLLSCSSMRVAHWLPEHIDPKITSKRLADWLKMCWEGEARAGGVGRGVGNQIQLEGGLYLDSSDEPDLVLFFLGQCFGFDWDLGCLSWDFERLWSSIVLFLIFDYSALLHFLIIHDQVSLFIISAYFLILCPEVD